MGAASPLSFRSVSPNRAARKLLISAGTVIALVGGLLVHTGLGAAPARADTAPDSAATAPTVAADSLPTTQINGVAWAQLIVGTTVFVGGEFTSARPAGAAAGTGEVVRNNLLAYDLTTGVLKASFNPNVNGAVRALVASPDGSRLYVGGAFTSIGGVARYRLAALNTSTGALVSSWSPQVNARVNALGINGSTVYAGGIFSSANGVARSKMAAFSTADGAVLPWAGNPTGGNVHALTVSPDGSKVVIGGGFTAYNGGSDPGYGMAATDASTGASLPWKVNSVVRNGGLNAAILSLTSSTDGVFGTGYVFNGAGNFEGAFRASWEDGTLIWLEDCHGDTYSAVPAQGVVYTTGHPHYCGNIGGFPQTDPWTYHRALTFGMPATGTITPDPHGYYNFAGNPHPDTLTFYPDINTGTYTGQGQGPWHVEANDDYVVYGGEFTIVNNKRQQGLARFATSDIAPNKEGPRLSGADFVPAVASFVAGSVRLSWPANYDRDNEHLSYEVLRDGVSVTTLVASSTVWNRPAIAWTDTGLTPGASHSYRLRVTDPFGNERIGNSVPVTVAESGTLSDYAETVLADARSYWPLGEASGTTAFDWASGTDATVGAGVSRGTAGAVLGGSTTASSFDGTTTGVATANTAEQASDTFTVEAWVKTESTKGGKIVGFGTSNTGTSSSYDRHVYMDNAGRIWFGVHPGSVRTVNSTTSYNDGQWHQVVATLGAAGMTLYVDGAKVAHRGDVTTGQAYSGYWRIGGDNLGGWTNRPTSNFIAADIDEVAVYDTSLTLAQVIDHYEASGRVSSAPQAPADPYGTAIYNAEPDLYWRLGEGSGTVAADSSRSASPGRYSGTVTQGASGLVGRTHDTAAAFNGGVVSSTVQVTDPRVYSLEAWFSTTTNQGGKIIGFGDAQTGLSGNYDRHVYLQDDGRLVFGTWTGTANTITTDTAYNDGKRHHVVAVQSATGMRLYVDGGIVGTHPQTAAQPYAGYWRVGGDPTWGSSSPYFAGTIDEVAVYSRDIGAPVIRNHHTTGTGGEPANTSPMASFTAAADQLSVTVDGSASADADGTITGYDWSWGDGETTTGRTSSHTYAAAGDYPVTLTVTDNAGATHAATRTVTVAAAENQPPTADFTVTPSGLQVAVDGAASADPDGSIAEVAWAFGDGGTATGATATHTYSVAGDYPITVTVTDDDGATATATKTVTVAAAPGGTAYATDAFERTVAGGLGAASPGGAWTVTGSTGNYSVSQGEARLRAAAAGATVAATLPDVSATDTEVRVNLALQQAATGSGAYLSVLGRKVGNDDYRARVKLTATGAVQLQLLRGGTSLRASTIPGLDYATGDKLNLVMQTTGTAPTTLSAKVWKVGTTEPTGWQVTTTDSTAALQKAGAIGLSLYLGGSATTVPVTMAIDDLWAGQATASPPPPPPANVAPTAAFTATASGLTAVLDAATSSDPDGTIAGYAWTFGDGGEASGAQASHEYEAPGDYPVTLTITDDDGATASATQSVTVSAPPEGGDLAGDAFERAVATGLGTADVGGAWTTTGAAGNYTVAQGAATLRSPKAGATATARLLGVTSTSTDVRVGVSVQQPATGTGTYLALLGRTVENDDYRARVRLNADGTVILQLLRGGTALRSFPVPGVTPAVGDQLTLRLQVTGTAPTSLRAKVWATGQSEPSAWQVETTDTTPALQGPGGLGISLYIGGTATNAPATARFDDLVAGVLP
ncbi:PKD domain-containing protein [Cryobacterium sp. 1639]|uniref:PKD domain-containing protein n=1 Tax=Cryobacterium inferilacus TaxID=2866629 RepID=UPI001C739D45|nr:PKD domain-containing protein [Cryobacterium sp. 1639]MBX0299473.1 PKD domain-containing protein [Cryobacterium sp. 1639]